MFCLVIDSYKVNRFKTILPGSLTYIVPNLCCVYPYTGAFTPSEGFVNGVASMIQQSIEIYMLFILYVSPVKCQS